jgi:hypothetical protein
MDCAALPPLSGQGFGGSRLWPVETIRGQRDGLPESILRNRPLSRSMTYRIVPSG